MGSNDVVMVENPGVDGVESSGAHNNPSEHQISLTETLPPELLGEILRHTKKLVGVLDLAETNKAFANALNNNLALIEKFISPQVTLAQALKAIDVLKKQPEPTSPREVVNPLWAFSILSQRIIEALENLEGEVEQHRKALRKTNPPAEITPWPDGIIVNTTDEQVRATLFGNEDSIAPLAEAITTLKIAIECFENREALREFTTNQLAINSAITHLKNIRDKAAETNNDGRTPLLLAAENGHAEIANTLLVAGADVNQADRENWTPLHMAAKNDHTEIVNALLAADADVNKADKCGRTPLHMAAKNDHTEIVNALLAADADVNKADKCGRTPLLLAAENGQAKIVKALLAAHADVNKADKDGYTPLYWATKNGHSAICDALLAADADVNKADKDGYTPLYWATKNGHSAICDALLAADADVNKTNRNGRTPLFWATGHGHIDIANALLAAGANVTQAQIDKITTFSWEGTHDGYNAILDAIRDYANARKELRAADTEDKAQKALGEAPGLALCPEVYEENQGNTIVLKALFSSLTPEQQGKFLSRIAPTNYVFLGEELQRFFKNAVKIKHSNAFFARTFNAICQALKNDSSTLSLSSESITYLLTKAVKLDGPTPRLLPALYRNERAKLERFIAELENKKVNIEKLAEIASMQTARVFRDLRGSAGSRVFLQTLR